VAEFDEGPLSQRAFRFLPRTRATQGNFQGNFRGNFQENLQRDFQVNFFSLRSGLTETRGTRFSRAVDVIAFAGLIHLSTGQVRPSGAQNKQHRSRAAA
jgi:hypothetical protein